MPEVPADETAIVAVSRPGAVLAMDLAASITDSDLYLERKITGGELAETPGVRLYDLPLRPVLQRLFTSYRRLVVFLPVGATVRLLAPVLVDKRRDAAVVCVDDAGRYAISLLSGHHGGADALAHDVAAAIGAQPVITSASDALDVTAVDLVGRGSGWQIEATPTDLTRAAAAVVNGGPVALWLDPETGARWPDDIPPSDGVVAVANVNDAFGGQFRAILVVSDRLEPFPHDLPNSNPTVVIYRPPTLVAGVGCRRGVDERHLKELLETTLAANNLSINCLASLATADIKANESGLVALAEHLGIPLHPYAAAELNAVAERQPVAVTAGSPLKTATPSAAQDLLGVFGVSEPAAMLAAGASGLVVSRTKSDRATVAIARIAPPQGSH